MKLLADAPPYRAGDEVGVLRFGREAEVLVRGHGGPVAETDLWNIE